MKTFKPFSIVIPTKDRAYMWPKLITALNKQTYSDFEVIIIDDGSGIENYQQVSRCLSTKARFPFQLIRVPESKGPAHARNLGIKKAKSKYILILNDDCIPSKNLINQHLSSHISYPQLNYGVIGKVTWHPHLSITPFMYWLDHGGPQFGFYKMKNGRIYNWEKLWTANVSFKRELIHDTLLDENFIFAAWEDLEWGYRLYTLKNLRLVYNQRALVYHYHPSSFENITKKMLYHGFSAVQLKGKIPPQYLPPIASPRLRPILILWKQIVTKLHVDKIMVFLCKKLENKMIFPFLFKYTLLLFRIRGSQLTKRELITNV